MNEFLELSKSLNLSYVYMHNGLIKDTNILGLDSLSLKKDLKFILIHDIDSDTTIDINVHSGINLSILEIFKINDTKDININKSITLDNNSTLDLVTVEYDDLTKDKHLLNYTIKTNLNENSKLTNSKIVLMDNKYIINDESNLNEENSYLENFNVYVNSSNDLQVVNAVVNHLHKDTQSQMKNYGICKGKSKLELNTNGYIKNGAKRSQVNQKNTGLLIDLESNITASPWLQIDEYDCLASHGAGIGALDEEAMYYLMSRGLNRLDSEKLIISGFVNPIFDKIENEQIKEKAINLINRYL